MDGVAHYATPLLCIKNGPPPKAPKEAVMARFRSTESKLVKNPEQAAAYIAKIHKLETSGYVHKLPPGNQDDDKEMWYIPHHMVQHNGKNRMVFDCSFQWKGQCLNALLLPGPTLSSSPLGVLLWIREHPAGISGDIKGMFHQVRLLPEDHPLLHFHWRDLKKEQPPSAYEWQVVPFGKTCSPYCATYAVQKHVTDNSQPGKAVHFSVEKCFYINNCLLSFPTTDAACHLLDKLRVLLSTGGFDLRHLPKEARSDSSELWLSQNKTDPQELTLGLSWHCESDTLTYCHRPVSYDQPTMRNIYRVLASQYDPLGYIIPYTTCAKILVQRLWDKDRGWDYPHLPDALLREWNCWEAELWDLSKISLP